MNHDGHSGLEPYTRQSAHAAGLILLMFMLFLVLRSFGTSGWWSFLAFASSAAHQGLVAFVWRRELFYPSKDERERKRIVRLFAIFFAVLIAIRIVLSVILSKDTRGSIALDPLFRLLGIGAIALLAGYTFYSVIRYFGMFRALGADHFDPSYKLKPFVTKGIYRFTSNGMYTFGIMLFLLPGLWFQSGEGIAFGFYHYIAIWIHYWATEKPDLQHLYG